MLSRACEWIQKEEKRLDFICKISRKKTLDFLEKAQVGDTLFWTAYSKDVKLLEKPTEFIQSAKIKCQASNGKVVEIPTYLLRRISKGNYHGEYFIEGIENEKKAKELEYKVKYHSFRAKIEKKDNGFLLKIYGDSQQEVDDFINLSLEQDFDISPYI